MNTYLYMNSMYPKSGARGLQRFGILKCHNAPEWEYIFISSELNTVEGIDYIEKSSNKSCVELNFIQKI